MASSQKLEQNSPQMVTDDTHAHTHQVEKEKAYVINIRSEHQRNRSITDVRFLAGPYKDKGIYVGILKNFPLFICKVRPSLLREKRDSQS